MNLGVLNIRSGVCVYAHSSDGIVFYVGKGTPHRPFETVDRTAAWKQAVGLAGNFTVTILGWFDSDQDARSFESAEIRRLRPAANFAGNPARHVRNIRDQRPKNPSAVALGKLGAKARAKKLTPEQRSDIARKAVNERWRRARAKAAA